jgi:hypothetical protein
LFFSITSVNTTFQKNKKKQESCRLEKNYMLRGDSYRYSSQPSVWLPVESTQRSRNVGMSYLPSSENFSRREKKGTGLQESVECQISGKSFDEWSKNACLDFQTFFNKKDADFDAKEFERNRKIFFNRIIADAKKQYDSEGEPIFTEDLSTDCRENIWNRLAGCQRSSLSSMTTATRRGTKRRFGA